MDDVFREWGVHLFIKEDYLSHDVISGNKMRKLKGNLLHFESQTYQGLISFGGAYSNHLYAMAGVSKEFGIPVTMIVRGDGFDPSNGTLAYAEEVGIELIYADRSSYRAKAESPFIREILDSRRNYFVIPEGGSNEFASIGVRELYSEIGAGYDYLCLSMGTGGTAAALLQASEKERIAIYPALKGDWIQIHMMENYNLNSTQLQRLVIRDNFHFGGYAKGSQLLDVFIDEIYQTHGLPLDSVYTGKAFYGVMSDIRAGFFPQDSKILFIHTGGLRPTDFPQ